MKILIVDDEYVSCSKLEAILSVYGNCDIATGGKQALAMFEKAFNESAAYDLITMDVDMPEMNGQETVKTIRKFENKYGIDRFNGVKIVMISCSEDHEDVVDAFKSGYICYMNKPVSQNGVRKKLENLGLLQVSKP